MSAVVALILRSQSHKGPAAVAESLGNWEGLNVVEQKLLASGVRTLTSFVYQDAALLEEMLELATDDDRDAIETRLHAVKSQPEWHEAHVGLASIRRILELLPATTDGIVLREELQRFERALVEAQTSGDVFRLEYG